MVTAPVCEPPTVAPVEPQEDKMNIWTASQVGDLFRVQVLVTEQPDLVHAPSPNDQIPPLHWAALNDRTSILRYLLEKGAVVNSLGGEQWSTALHWATTKGHIDAMSTLVTFGADLALRDQPGYTALHLAAQHGQTLAVLYLLALGVDVEERDGFGRTALLWATFRGHVETVQVLLQDGANPDSMDNGGTTVLHWAVIKGHYEIIRLLFKYRADPSVKDAEGKTAADWAKQKDHYKWFSILLIEFGRKNLLKDLAPLNINYWRPARGRAKFIMGKIVPCIVYPLYSLVLWTVSPWVLALGIVIAIFMVYDKYIRTLFFPSINPTETGMVFAYQAVMIPPLFLLDIFVLYPATPSHYLLHLFWTATVLSSVYFLRRVNQTDPGILRPPLTIADRHQLILELTLPIADVTAGSFCIMSNRLCRQAILAPFVFVCMVEKCTFILWVGFLLVVQTWQIAKNQTTNEVSNWYRLEYFNPDTTVPAEDHEHGPKCSHGTKLKNPFDRGTLLNCTEFCLGASDTAYYEMHVLPVTKVPEAILAASPSLKTALLNEKPNTHITPPIRTLWKTKQANCSMDELAAKDDEERPQEPLRSILSNEMMMDKQGGLVTRPEATPPPPVMQSNEEVRINRSALASLASSVDSVGTPTIYTGEEMPFSMSPEDYTIGPAIGICADAILNFRLWLLCNCLPHDLCAAQHDRGRKNDRLGSL
ncbi:Palmitoyltransferase [Paramicrosporidium saccamoebae]|uniref:protein S-acyltransferase n=1 Tax=Paramicrosporidium saccamoebae TaxID=1246581 RepID=A0A2H9TG80_9FUNG|nr:Palmitoyltransferase [Paramicrosporidium saccamoebae]